MKNTIEDRLIRLEEKVDALQFHLKKEVMRLELEDKIMSDYFDRVLDIFEKLNEEMSGRRETTNMIQERLDTEIARHDANDKTVWDQLKQLLKIIVMLKDDAVLLRERTQKAEENGQGYALDIHKRLDLHADQIKLMLIRLDDIYYHVFPGRLRQDVQVLDQIEALTPKRNPDGGGTKDG